MRATTKALRKVAMTARGASTPTTRTLVLIRKRRKTITHVLATANYIAAISVKPLRTDTTQSLVFKLLVTAMIVIGTATVTIALGIETAITIVVGIIVAATGTDTATMVALSSFAKRP